LPVVTPDFFFGVGATILLVPQVGPGAPELHDVVARWELPRNWRAACSWGVGQSVGDRLRSADLRHAAYMAGPLVTDTSRIGGADVTVAMVGRFGFDAGTLASTVATIAADQAAFMRDPAFPPHVVTLVPVGSPVEHGAAKLLGQGFHHGLALWLAPEADLTEGLEHVVAHELMHYWIGGVLKPADPEEQALWFIEGFTDYYALRRLWQSGRWDDETLARWLNRHLAAYHSNPARNASNVDVQARARTSPETFGEVAYQRGLLLGLRWNRIARERGIQDGVDALTWSLVQRGRGAGFRLSSSAVRETGTRVLGTWFESEFDRFVTRGETIELPVDALGPTLRYLATESGGRFERATTPQ
jgi:predicted metalloprotease with PDZ domain